MTLRLGSRGLSPGVIDINEFMPAMLALMDRVAKEALLPP